jgi:hypothetical protein
MRKSKWSVCVVLALALCLPLPALAEDFAVIDIGSTTVRWEIRGDFESVVLTVSQPNTKVYSKEIRAGEPVGFDLGDAARDGVYKWQLLGIPRFDASVREELKKARARGTECEVIEKLRDAGLLPDTATQSGAFSVQNGALVPPDLDEGTQLKAPSASRQPVPRQDSGGPQIITAADQVIPDDLIVQGSACIGFDCVNNENFSFDTIRLKENNLRIKFEDTSVGTFPTNDWQLTANDSASGGQSKLSIEDITGNRVPFTVEAGASTNSVYVDSTGRVGFRTSTPVLDLHVNTSNTPAIRLEQNNSGGFTAQTWDIAGNEANFFVRDVTGGSRLPFRIRPGAPTSSIDISADGDVGIGTASPSTKLHVLSNEATSTSGRVLIQNTSALPTAREGLEILNNGQALFILKDTSQAPRWAIGTLGTSFVVDNQANGGTELTLTSNGNLTVPGTVNGVSDRSMKKDIVPVRREEILAKLAALPIATWTYKSEDDIRHMGPMAQDFSAAFGLGMDDKHIAPTDMAGVTMAAVQALHQEVTAKDAEIAGLKQRNDDLAKRLADLEALVSSLAASKK